MNCPDWVYFLAGFGIGSTISVTVFLIWALRSEKPTNNK